MTFLHTGNLTGPVRSAKYLHIALDDELAQNSTVTPASAAGSALIAELIRRGCGWEDIEAALGWIPDEGHDWHADPAQWVWTQRRSA